MLQRRREEHTASVTRKHKFLNRCIGDVVFQKILMSQHSHKLWYYNVLLPKRRQCYLEGHAIATIFLLPMSLSKVHFFFPKLNFLHLTFGVFFFASLRCLQELKIYFKQSHLLCFPSPGAHTFNVDCNSANPSTLRLVHLHPSILLTSYTLFVLYLIPLLLNIFLSHSVRAAAKAAQGAHIRLELWSDH